MFGTAGSAHAYDGTTVHGCPANSACGYATQADCTNNQPNLAVNVIGKVSIITVPIIRPSLA